MNNTNKKSLIITLKIDEKSQEFFNLKRKQYYPAYANFVNAHITLFHKLPIDNLIVQDILFDLCKTNVFEMQIVGIKIINNFVAYEITSFTLQNIHAKMQTTFANMINEKDKEKLWPHITIQNKATSYKALKTHKILITDFVPFSITAKGFTCWFYQQKKWTWHADYLFN